MGQICQLGLLTPLLDVKIIYLQPATGNKGFLNESQSTNHKKKEPPHTHTHKTRHLTENQQEPSTGTFPKEVTEAFTKCMKRCSTSLIITKAITKQNHKRPSIHTHQSPKFTWQSIQMCGWRCGAVWPVTHCWWGTCFVQQAWHYPPKLNQAIHSGYMSRLNQKALTKTLRDTRMTTVTLSIKRWRSWHSRSS